MANDSCQMFATSRDLTAAAAALIAGSRRCSCSAHTKDSELAQQAVGCRHAKTRERQFKLARASSDNDYYYYYIYCYCYRRIHSFILGCYTINSNSSKANSLALRGVNITWEWDVMWVSCRRARYFPSSRHQQHVLVSILNVKLIHISGFTFAFIDDDSRV